MEYILKVTLPTLIVDNNIMKKKNAELTCSHCAFLMHQSEHKENLRIRKSQLQTVKVCKEIIHSFSLFLSSQV